MKVAALRGFRTLRKGMAVCLLVACVAAIAVSPAAADASSETLAPYQPGAALSGTIISVGSDTMVNMMTLWGEAFRKAHPNVKIEIEGKGSSTGPPALVAGTAQFAPMSREMKPSEIDAFEQKYGYKPTQLKVAIDGLAVYVNKDNPLEALTLPQVDAIFARNPRCGAPRAATTWGDVGVTGSFAQRPISLYGRNSASGTYGFFKDVALCGGDYKESVKEQPGSAAVVQGVAVDLYGIGYSGLGYVTSGVKPLALARSAGEPAIAPTEEGIVSGEYPLSRFLYVYINKAPGQPLPPLVAEFVKYIYSQDGQNDVVKDGYIALPAAFAVEQLNQVIEQ